jgi:carbamoyl-phosphate synthase small subunit
MSSTRHARLVLEDGAIFSGDLYGNPKSVSGEVVFNTGMVGYPESLTDPSYRGQILTFTYPLIGNYGVPNNDVEDAISQQLESTEVQVRATIIADYTDDYNHWEADTSLSDWLDTEGVPLLAGIDTRALTQHLREEGTMLGKVIVEGDVSYHDPNDYNVVDEVSPDNLSIHGDGSTRIVAVDCGMKHNIIREFLTRDVQLIRVPWNYDFTQLDYDGLFISNGPGDPKYCKATIKHVEQAMMDDTPIFGICLGNQVMAMAAGARSYKLKYGHRGQNQPCIETGTERCIITSQNHGFAIRRESLNNRWNEWFVNANDGTNEGIKHTSKPFFAVQFHPESNPGPNDAHTLFDTFLEEIR